jgi:hypothetical protein
MSLKDILNKKNKRIYDIPEAFQKSLEGQQSEQLTKVNALLQRLQFDGDNLRMSNANLQIISDLTYELKSIVLTDEYIKDVTKFANEFTKQAAVNKELISMSIEGAIIPQVADAYISNAKKNAIESLIGAPIDANFIKPIQSLLETAVTSGSSTKETLESIRLFVAGSPDKDSKLLKYAKQITNDSFAIADRTYTNIVATALDIEWYYYSGGDFATTRCFCEERVGNYYHYLEIESWGKGKNLGKCNIGGGKWAGMIPTTDKSTIFTFAGGYNCQHSIMPVSDLVVPKSDKKRAKELGFID